MERFHAQNGCVASVKNKYCNFHFNWTKFVTFWFLRCTWIVLLSLFKFFIYRGCMMRKFKELWSVRYLSKSNSNKQARGERNFNSHCVVIISY